MRLRTKTSDGKATAEGMKLLLATLRDSIAQEAPVRVNELFLAYFYSPAVWRRNNETMAQYIIRRESEFARLKEASSETQISSNLKCMLLLLFSGLDAKEQQGILSSVNNEYDYKKVSHALRIQFPSAISRPVARRDYLGAGKGGGHAGAISPRPSLQQKVTRLAPLVKMRSTMMMTMMESRFPMRPMLSIQKMKNWMH